MKTIFLTIAMGFSFLSCEKNQSETEVDPITYNLNFELLKIDGSAYENDEVEITSNTYLATLADLTNGQYSYLGMGKIYTETQGNDKIFFGTPCGGPNCHSEYLHLPIASSAEGVDVNGAIPFEKDKYWLLRYANEDVDTLRIRDVQTVNPYNRAFTFFVNEQEVEATNFIFEEYAITIQK